MCVYFLYFACNILQYASNIQYICMCTCTYIRMYTYVPVYTCITGAFHKCILHVVPGLHLESMQSGWVGSTLWDTRESEWGCERYCNCVYTTRFFWEGGEVGINCIFKICKVVSKAILTILIGA